MDHGVGPFVRLVGDGPVLGCVQAKVFQLPDVTVTGRLGHHQCGQQPGTRLHGLLRPGARRQEAKEKRRHPGVAFHVADGHKADHGRAQQGGDQALDEHGAVHDNHIEGEPGVELANVLKKIAHVAGEDLFTVKTNRQGALEPGALGIQLVEVVRCVFDRPDKGEMTNAKLRQFSGENVPRVKRHLMPGVLEAHGDSRHGIEMPGNRLAGQQDLHGRAPARHGVRQPKPKAAAMVFTLILRPRARGNNARPRRQSPRSKVRRRIPARVPQPAFAGVAPAGVGVLPEAKSSYFSAAMKKPTPLARLAHATPSSMGAQR